MTVARVDEYYSDTNLTAPPPDKSPWSLLEHMDTEECELRLREICRLLAAAECAELLLDQLLELFQQPDCELAYIINCFGSAPNSPPSLAKRILDTYLEEELWYLPLEVNDEEPPITEEETLDVEVYNPRSWIKDTIPGLYEGATEVRYTGVAYDRPRGGAGAGAGAGRGASSCSSAAQAQRNVALCCLLTEGVGEMAARLQDQFQPYLLRTLCLLLERVGSRYQLVRGAGLRALDALAAAGAHASTAQLLAANADYITSQVNRRLKKAWTLQSGLEILSVVMQYSDVSILDYLYGIMDDVLLSCDKYHERNPHAYLEVFSAFTRCIGKWFRADEREESEPGGGEVDVVGAVVEFARSKEEAERLLGGGELEGEGGKSAEEMYREDQREKEESVLDYDDTVTKETPPPPRHVLMTEAVLRRCVHLAGGVGGSGGVGSLGGIGSLGGFGSGGFDGTGGVYGSRGAEVERVLLALKVLRHGLAILDGYDDQLLPLVHSAWPALCAALTAHPLLARAALELLVVMATLTQDFIRPRAEKDALPLVYKYLSESRPSSELKGRGSAYRLSGAFALQRAALGSLPPVARALRLSGAGLARACRCAKDYLSRRQPRPLQELAVDFFKDILDSNYAVGWCFLRDLCANDDVLEPPFANLEPVVGTPYRAVDADYDKNIRLIFSIDSE
ncbi:unnamed protein product, partial [Iphiclides podalirius]